MKKVMVFDSTLRDGSHANRHQLTKAQISSYCHSVDEAGLYTVIVGHGNGLGASSLQVGQSLLSDNVMLETARENLTRTRLGAFLIPGFGTIADNVIPAIDIGVDLFCIASHCTEADVTRQHIEFVRSRGKEAYGVLMMYHMASPERVLEEALKMQSYGAMGIILMDSAGASTPSTVKHVINLMNKNISIPIGFHPHNNMGLAVSNAFIAISEGAGIIDGTVRGFGAGAGNVQLEALCAVLEKEGFDSGTNLYKLLDTSEIIVKKMFGFDKGIDPISIVSGLSGVFSAFAPHVIKAAERYDVSPFDIFIELGKQRVVGGQEDKIIEIAIKLSEKRINENIVYQLESLL